MNTGIQRTKQSSCIVTYRCYDYNKTKKTYTKYYIYAKDVTSGFRPVFLLNTNAKVIGGEGTIENPYKLGI